MHWEAPSLVDVECLNEEDRRSLADADYHFEDTSWIPYNLSFEAASGNYTTWLNAIFDNHTVSLMNTTKGAVSSKCVYQYDVMAINSVYQFLNKFLNGKINPGEFKYDVQLLAPLHTIYSIWNVTFDRVNETWKTLSDSITTYMRQHGAETRSAPAIGQAFHNQTCVHIQWPFLAYPAVLVLSAVVFFVCTVFETRRGDTSRHDWKSSPLALLYHGLDRQSLQSEEPVQLVKAKEMEKLAEHMTVRLSQTEHGWQFVGTRESTSRKW
jgi:DNA polymerase IIIc chi subunit